MRQAPRIRVVVADDHHLVRQGMRSLLEKASDIEVVSEAADGHKAVELVERLAPDVLVTYIAMPRLDGNHAIAQLLTVSVKTVEKHRSNLMSKLNVHDLAGLMRVGIKLGLILLDE